MAAVNPRWELRRGRVALLGPVTILVGVLAALPVASSTATTSVTASSTVYLYAPFYHTTTGFSWVYGHTPRNNCTARLPDVAPNFQPSSGTLRWAFYDHVQLSSRCHVAVSVGFNAYRRNAAEDERIHSGMLIGSPSVSRSYAIGLNLTLRGWENWSMVLNPCPSAKGNATFTYHGYCDESVDLGIYILLGYVYDETTHSTVGPLQVNGGVNLFRESAYHWANVTCGSTGSCSYVNWSGGALNGNVWIDNDLSMSSHAGGIRLNSTDVYRVVFTTLAWERLGYGFTGLGGSLTWHTDLHTSMDFAGGGKGIQVNWISLS